MLARNSLADEEHTWRHLLWVESNTRRRWSAEFTWTVIRFSQHTIVSFQASFWKTSVMALKKATHPRTDPCLLPLCSTWLRKGDISVKSDAAGEHTWSLLSLVCIHALTYDPGGSSNGSQSDQHHTHSKHTAGGQHTGQRDSSVPYKQHSL